MMAFQNKLSRYLVFLFNCQRQLSLGVPYLLEKDKQNNKYVMTAMKLKINQIGTLKKVNIK